TRIGKLTTDGQLTEYLIAPFVQPWDITVGPDGALWFTEEDADLIGRITTDGGYTEYSTGTCCFPTEITSAGGFLWFTMEQGPSIVKMDTQGFVHTFNYPDASELAYAIATGPDGKIWGSDIIGPHVVRVAPGGVHTLKVAGSQTGVAGLATGPDGLLWYRAVPRVAVVPDSGTEVRAIVRACHDAGVPWVARGSGTGLSGGALPVEDGVLIVLTRLRSILEVDLPNQRVTVEPG